MGRFSRAACRSIACAAICLLSISPRHDARAEEPSLDGLKVTSVGPSGPPGMRVSLVLLGDGYVKEDFAPGGRWAIDAGKLVANFFEKEPFKSQRALFNVHLVEVPSLDRGADDAPDKHAKRTAFGCCYGARGIARLLVARDKDAVLRALKNAPAADVAVILVNDSRPGGSGGLAGDVPCPVCSTEANAFLTAIHELGHSLAKLGDEYVDERSAPTYPVPESGDLPYPNLTLAKFVDASSRDALLRTLKWARWIRSGGPDAGPGYFEGGYYRAKGVYRPAKRCAMQTEDGAAPFCYVCVAEMRRAICRAANRGPTGAFAVLPLAPMQGTLAGAFALYEEAKLAKALTQARKVAKEPKAGDDDRKNAAALEEAIAKSVGAGFEKIDAMVRTGDVAGARELAGLMEAACKGTEWANEVDAKKREIKK